LRDELGVFEVIVRNAGAGNEELAVTVHGRVELFDIFDPARGGLRQAMLDHYLPRQGPVFETWLDQLWDHPACLAGDLDHWPLRMPSSRSTWGFGGWRSGRLP
jgi:hypothetical protein